MLRPSIPIDEENRLAALHALNILDTPPEERFDRLTRLARRLLGVPIAVVSLVDSNRQWFKSCQGLDARETPRSISFCGHAILDDNIFIIPDARMDSRFADNPLVSGAPHIRFYAGQPLKSKNGCRVGTLCVFDSVPHDFTQAEIDSLRDLAMLVEEELNSLEMHELMNELRHSQERLATIFDNVLDGIITINGSGIIESFNKAAEQIFGYAAAEVMGNNVKMLMPAPYHDQHDHHIHQFIHTGNKKIIGIRREVVGLRKDGSIFPMELAVSENRFEDKWLFTGIVRDISKRNESEETLLQTRLMLDNIVEHIPAMVFVKRASDLNFELFNKFGEQLTGYPRQDLLGKNDYDFFPVEQADFFIATDRRVLTSEGVIEIPEESIQNISGETRFLRTWKTALRNANGEATHLLGISVDITEHKKIRLCSKRAMSNFATCWKSALSQYASCALLIRNWYLPILAMPLCLASRQMMFHRSILSVYTEITRISTILLSILDARKTSSAK